MQELLLSEYEIHSIYCTKDFLHENSNKLTKAKPQIFEAEPEQLAEVGTYLTNKSALAVVEIKENIPLSASKDEFALVLDDIKDPGNLGTIIRIADWFGIQKVIASETTVDLYNPKVINASMGSFTRVRMFYTDLRNFIQDNVGPYYGAFLDGEDVHNVNFERQGYLVIGNEASGIESSLHTFIDRRVFIPRYGGAESLNAGVATAIILDNIQKSISFRS